MVFREVLGAWREEVMRKLKVNDFFCGCGGLGIAFQEAGYEIVKVKGVDMFANTYHCETICYLSLK